MKYCSENEIVCTVGVETFSELNFFTELFQQGILEEKFFWNFVIHSQNEEF